MNVIRNCRKDTKARRDTKKSFVPLHVFVPLWQAPMCFIIILSISLFCTIGCSGLHYSSKSLSDDQSIEKQSLALIKKSDEPYSSHATEVDSLKSHIAMVIQKEKKRKMNFATVAMWNEVMTAKGNLFDLLDLWKTSGHLSHEMTKQAAVQIERLLNSISDLENHKKK